MTARWTLMVTKKGNQNGDNSKEENEKKESNKENNKENKEKEEKVVEEGEEEKIKKSIFSVLFRNRLYPFVVIYWGQLSKKRKKGGDNGRHTRKSLYLCAIFGGGSIFAPLGRRETAR